MLSLRTAGESHGPEVLALLEGLPHRLPLDAAAIAAIDAELARRQLGHGRGGRMQIESDHVEIVAGVRAGQTIGAPVVLRVVNRDSTIEKLPPVTAPRPGHADLAGALRFGIADARDVLERSSARETAARVAGGALRAGLVDRFGIRVVGYVTDIGGMTAAPNTIPADLDALCRARERSFAR